MLREGFQKDLLHNLPKNWGWLVCSSPGPSCPSWCGVWHWPFSSHQVPPLIAMTWSLSYLHPCMPQLSPMPASNFCWHLFLHLNKLTILVLWGGGQGVHKAQPVSCAHLPYRLVSHCSLTKGAMKKPKSALLKYEVMIHSTYLSFPLLWVFGTPASQNHCSQGCFNLQIFNQFLLVREQ